MTIITTNFIIFIFANIFITTIACYMSCLATISYFFAPMIIITILLFLFSTLPNSSISFFFLFDFWLSNSFSAWVACLFTFLSWNRYVKIYNLIVFSSFFCFLRTTEVVIKSIITVIIMTYKTNSKENKETVTSTRKYLGKYAKKYLLFRATSTTRKKSKTTTKRKNKNSDVYNNCNRSLSQEWIDWK